MSSKVETSRDGTEKVTLRDSSTALGMTTISFGYGFPFTPPGLE